MKDAHWASRSELTGAWPAASCVDDSAFCEQSSVRSLRSKATSDIASADLSRTMTNQLRKSNSDDTVTHRQTVQVCIQSRTLADVQRRRLPGGHRCAGGRTLRSYAADQHAVVGQQMAWFNAAMCRRVAAAADARDAPVLVARQLPPTLTPQPQRKQRSRLKQATTIINFALGYVCPSEVSK